MTDISLILEPPLARIRLNRRDKRNAMSRAMWLALPGLCAEIAGNGEALVVILEGSGGHFCAGADIGEFAVVYRDAAATADYVEAIQAGLKALMALERPTIAALRGSAVGGGLALAIACDLRFCAADAVLAITPAKLGLLYGFAETRRLLELIGPARAKDLLFSGRRVECHDAAAMGLVDRICPPEALDRDIYDYAMHLAGLSQHSIRGAKAVIDAIAGGLAAESAALRARIERAALSADFAEGRAAFLGKRKPHFASSGPPFTGA